MKYFNIILILILVVACKQGNDSITDSEDYNIYLKVERPQTNSKYFQLWNSKINSDSTQLLSFGNVAGEYNRYFTTTGNIEFLKKAEQALVKAVEIANIGQASYARALARNYISQHRFKEALEMAKLADSVGGGRKDTQALFFDVHMELGNYSLAEKYLDSIKNISDFGYLIRNGKWNDFKGDLDTTIAFMEMALEKAESSKNKNLLLWSYTNLADYYGHAGRIKDSYKGYLKALALDSGNAYAKKGIAWIVFSHEKNGKEALRILDAIATTHNTPDHHLLKAEIFDFMGNDVEKAQSLDAYFNSIQNPSYGVMYNTYTIDFLLDHAKQANPQVLDLAMLEVKNRATPESYHFLAKTYLKMGKEKEALKIVEEKINGKTFEPGILLNVAKVYKANGLYDEVNNLKNELEEAVYELGPGSKEEIEML